MFIHCSIRERIFQFNVKFFHKSTYIEQRSILLWDFLHWAVVSKNLNSNWQDDCKTGIWLCFRFYSVWADNFLFFFKEFFLELIISLEYLIKHSERGKKTISRKEKMIITRYIRGMDETINPIQDLCRISAECIQENIVWTLWNFATSTLPLVFLVYTNL